MEPKRHDTKSYKVPISIKGILFDGGSVWLRKNERSEWELPGGKIDEGEQPMEAVTRELREELGFEVEVIKIVHAWMYKIQKSHDESFGVLVLSYLCKLLKKTGTFEMKGESGKAEFKRFDIKEIGVLDMPKFYKNSIHLGWNEFLRAQK